MYCLGANWFFRKIAAFVSTVVDITQDGNKFSVKVQNLYMTKESHFTVDEEFEELHMITEAPMKVFFVKHFIRILLNCSEVIRVA